MPAIKRLARGASIANAAKNVTNWYPGHMYAGMQAIFGKLNTVDCVIEVHDARIPQIGRNKEFRKHLGLIKPHILVLNKCDLADLSHWDQVRRKLEEQGDENVLLTDMSGSEFTHEDRGYDKLLSQAVSLITNADRFNRETISEYKIMIVGIPNVGKSTLINRLRQHHLGLKGKATRTGCEAGVTRHVETKIRICSRPLIYSLDTPGILQPTSTRNRDRAMKLALCSTINDRVLRPMDLAAYLLKYLRDTNNTLYVEQMGLQDEAKDVTDLCQKSIASYQPGTLASSKTPLDYDEVCWKFVTLFRKGYFGKVMFQ